MGEPEVIVGAGGHPGGQGVALLLQRAAAGGVQGDPRAGRVAEPAFIWTLSSRLGPF